MIKDVLFSEHPEITWKLSISLLLNNTRSTSGISKPSYKEWSRGVEEKPLQSEYINYISTIADLLIEKVSENISEETLELLDNFDSFNDGQRQAVLEIFDNIDKEKIEFELRAKLLGRLRETVSRHREYHDSEWALPSEILDQLEKVYDKVQFDDPVLSNTYIFDDFWPNLIDPWKRRDYGYEERKELVSELRRAALKEIYEIKGSKGIEELCIRSKLPSIIGNSAYRSDKSQCFKTLALGWLKYSDARSDFSKAYLEALAVDDFPTIIKIVESDELDDEEKSKVILCIPITSSSLDFLDGVEEGLHTYFWKNVTRYFCQDDINAARVASELIKHDRPLASIESLASVLYSKKVSTFIDSRLVCDILTRIAIDPSDKDSTSIANVRNVILKGIQYIQDQGDLPKQEIRQVEWAFLKAFRSEEVVPRYLVDLISQEPDFFCELITWVWKRDDGKEDEVEELTQEVLKHRAESAMELLGSIYVLPGTTGSKIDRTFLREWVIDARTRLKELGRSNVGDHCIGKILANSPVGEDGIWPHEAVRDLIEKTKSPKLDQSILIEKRNNRGVTSRHPYSGGDQERELSKSYRESATSIQLVYPRTSEILSAIATSYERDAEREDREAELR